MAHKILCRVDEFLVFNVLRFQHFEKRIAEKVRVLTIVESPTHFVKVGLQMLRTDLMPCTDDATLQQRETRLNAVRVNVTNGVDTIHMLDCLVLAEDASIMQRLRIALKLVGHNHVNIVRDIFLDVFRQRTRLHILGMKESQWPATLPDADYNFFLALRMAYFVLMAALLAAYKGFVYFYCAAQLGTIIGSSHRSADAVTEIPCSLIALFAEHPVNLTSRHALLGFGQQIRDEEPLSQWQMGVMKHGSH